MKKLIIFFCFAIAGIYPFSEVQGSSEISKGQLNLTDTVVFNLATATYSNVGGVFYIDIPVAIYSNNQAINALDFWFQFNQNKLTYVSTLALESGIDPFTNFNVNNQVLSNTTSGTSISYSAPLYSDLLILRFSLATACTEIFASDFSSTTALVNGNLSSYLFINPDPIPSFQIQQPQPYCSSDEIVFNYPYTTANGRIIQTYSWDFGNGQLSSLQSDTAVYTSEGDYLINLTLTTVDGCVYPIENSISIFPTPVAAFSSLWDEPTNVVSFTNESTISSGTINLYTWDFGTSTSNLQNPDFTFPALGYYDVTLTATSDLGCTSSITQVVSAIDIVELENRSFHIFPNPANDLIQIESSFHTQARITDVTGRILTENFIIQSNQVLSYNISELSTGFYFLESVEGDTIFRERFVVQK
jgi:PKD repeat protein